MWPIWLCVAGILILATLLRFDSLGQEPLWMDEAATVRLLQGDLWDLIDPSRHFENTPPLYYLLMHGWNALGGRLESDALLRVPSAAWGVLGVAAGAWVAGLAAGRFGRGAVVTAGLLAVAWSGVYYSREARAYAMFLTLATLAVGAAIALLRCPDGRRAALLAGATALAWWTHYSAAAVILATNAAAAWAIARPAADGPPRRALIRWWLASQIFALALILPTLPWAMRGAGGLRGDVDRTLGRAVLQLDAYRWLVGERWMLVLLLACAGVAIVRGRIEGWAKVMLAALVVLPVAFPLAAWLAGGPAFFPRHGLMAGVGLAILAGLGVERLRPRGVGVAAGAAIVAAAGAALLLNWQRLTKPPMRDAAAHVAQVARPGDTVVVSLMMSGWSFDRYFPREDVRRRDYDDFTVRAVVRGAPGIDAVWLVLCGNPHPDSHLFAGSPLQVADERQFGEIRVLRLRRPPATRPDGQ